MRSITNTTLEKPMYGGTGVFCIYNIFQNFPKLFPKKRYHYPDLYGIINLRKILSRLRTITI